MIVQFDFDRRPRYTPFDRKPWKSTSLTKIPESQLFDRKQLTENDISWPKTPPYRETQVFLPKTLWPSRELKCAAEITHAKPKTMILISISK